MILFCNGEPLTDAQTSHRPTLSQSQAHSTISLPAMKHSCIFSCILWTRKDSPMGRPKKSRGNLEWSMIKPDNKTQTVLYFTLSHGGYLVQGTLDPLQ